MSDRKSFCSFPANFKRQLIKSLKCRQEQRGLNIWGEEGERGSVGSSLICFLPNSSPFTWPCQLPAWGDLCQSLPNSLRNSYRGRLCLCCAPFTPLSFSNVPPRSPNLLSGFASSGVQLCKVLSMQNKFYTLDFGIVDNGYCHDHGWEYSLSEIRIISRAFPGQFGLVRLIHSPSAFKLECIMPKLMICI